MRVITKKVVTAYRQDPDKISLFHKFDLPEGICLGFTEPIGEHRRDICFEGKQLKAVRCFWLKGDSTIVIHVSLTDRNKMVREAKK